MYWELRYQRHRSIGLDRIQQLQLKVQYNWYSQVQASHQLCPRIYLLKGVSFLVSGILPHFPEPPSESDMPGNMDDSVTSH